MIGPGQVVSIGVGLAIAVEVDIGVGVGGGPGHNEIACRNGPGGAGVKQVVTGMPPAIVGHGNGVPPPLPQLQEKATATSIIAAPIRIHRARSIIGIQL